MRRETTFVLAAAVLFLLSAACDVEARTWYVNEAGTGDAPTIQAAMDSAAYGDTVLVGPGTYLESVEVADGTTLTSELGPTVTILTHPVYMVWFGPGISGSVEGFTIAGTEYVIDYGAVVCEEAEEVLIRGNLIMDNADCGIMVLYSSAEVRENTIINNGWHGIRCVFGYPRNLYNNLIVGNSGGIYSIESYGPIECNDCWGNGGDYDLEYSNEYLHPSNFTEDPLFCDAENGDFTLNSCSPCLPGSHPGGYDCGLIGAFGEGCDYPSAIQEDTWGAVKVLFR